jgi:aldose 1-epimerase
MNAHVWGALPDGRQVRRMTLRAGRMQAQLLTLGAIVQDLRIDGIDHPLVLGSPDLAAYLGPARYFGATVGRFANRIGGGRFTIEERDYVTDRNFRDRHTLHGGAQGADIQVWSIETLAEDRVTLSLQLPDGHMGFPGHMRITAQIALSEDAISFTYLADSDRPTPCSLAHHGYFDLDGRGDIRGHRLMIAAEHYLPVDVDLIPTGDIAPVAQTAFDFRSDRLIGDHGFDHNFCLSDAPLARRVVARATGQSGLVMQVETTACGLQFYDAAHLDGLPGLDGRVYGPHAGLALETQHWPDAMNQPGFPDPILQPGQTYREATSYRFLLPPR